MIKTAVSTFLLAALVTSLFTWSFYKAASLGAVTLFSLLGEVPDNVSREAVPYVTSLYMTMFLGLALLYFAYRKRTLAIHLATVHFIVMFAWMCVWRGERDNMGFWIIPLIPDFPGLILFSIIEPLLSFLVPRTSPLYLVFLQVVFTGVGTAQWFLIGQFFQKKLQPISKSR